MWICSAHESLKVASSWFLLPKTWTWWWALMVFAACAAKSALKPVVGAALSVVSEKAEQTTASVLVATTHLMYISTLVDIFKSRVYRHFSFKKATHHSVNEKHSRLWYFKDFANSLRLAVERTKCSSGTAIVASAEKGVKSKRKKSRLWQQTFSLRSMKGVETKLVLRLQKKKLWSRFDVSFRGK